MKNFLFTQKFPKMQNLFIIQGLIHQVKNSKFFPKI